MPKLAPNGMGIIKRMRLDTAVTANITKLNNCEMLALAKAFQVYTATVFV